MTKLINNTNPCLLVAIDVAKSKHDILIEYQNGSRKKLRIMNNLVDFNSLYERMKKTKSDIVVGLKATGHYHRPIAYFLHSKGIEINLISSLAMAKTREARYNSWDKNDPKDAQVILYMLKTGLTQTYHDPLVNKINDIQELSNTYHQVSLRKTKLQHSILTHYLPLYFPEAQKYFHSTRAKWFADFFGAFACPAAITKYSLEDFIEEAWKISGRKVDKTNWLKDIYFTASNSIGIPVKEQDQAMEMFRLILKEFSELCARRNEVEKSAEQYLEGNEDYHRIRTVPGIGSVIALTVLAEAGNLRRFGHYKQFLKYCGFDLATQQSGGFRGKTKLSKRGNGRLRQVFWMAATIAIRMRENTFRKRYHNLIKDDPTNADMKRKAYVAVAIKMARVVYSLIKNNTDYRCYYE